MFIMVARLVGLIPTMTRGTNELNFIGFYYSWIISSLLIKKKSSQRSLIYHIIYTYMNIIIYLIAKYVLAWLANYLLILKYALVQPIKSHHLIDLCILYFLYLLMLKVTNVSITRLNLILFLDYSKYFAEDQSNC